MADADSRFDWDDGNIEHIARHGLEPFEAEERSTTLIASPTASSRSTNRASSP